MNTPYENVVLSTTFIMEVDGIASEVEKPEGLLKVTSETTTKTDPLTGRRRKIITAHGYEDVTVTFREHGGTAVALWKLWKAGIKTSFTVLCFAQDKATPLVTVTAVDCDIADMSGFEGLDLESNAIVKPTAKLIIGEYTSVI